MLNKNHTILNSSGCWGSNETQLDELFNTKLNAVITKTCTLHFKKGNAEPTFYSLGNLHINSKGLPNEGYIYYKALYNKYKLNNKKYILSVAWECNENNTLELLQNYNNHVTKQELVELNLSCPNLEHEIPSYNYIMLDKILKLINNLNLNNLIFSLKLSPFLDHKLCDKIINTINSNNNSKIYKYIVLSNSIPNGLILNNGSPALSNIFGGLSGNLNKYIALSNVYYFKNKLDKNIEIIGCGGISNVYDIKDYLNNGANYVQLGSCFYDSFTNSLDYDKINSVITTYKLLDNL